MGSPRKIQTNSLRTQSDFPPGNTRSNLSAERSMRHWRAIYNMVIAMTRTQRPQHLKVPRHRIADFCKRWSVTELSLFGSVLREDFRPDSDVDVLISFAPNSRQQRDDLQRMQQELSTIFGRRVDLVRRDLIESSKNYIRRKHILENAESIYVA